MLDMSRVNWDFPVESQPVFDSNGNEINGQQCIMRTDTQEVLGVHGSRYKLVSHDDVINSIMDGVKQADVSRDYDMNVYVYENGRKMRGEIIFPDLTVEPSVGDYTQFKIDFTNSYDAVWAFAQSASGLRLWCMNGCTTPDIAARTRAKHTASLSVEGSAAKISNGLEHFMTRGNVWKSWMGTPINDNQAESFFKNTVAKAFTKQLQVTKTNEKQLENLITIWRDEKALLGANKWAMYNCLTYWATHTHDMKSPHTARYNREQDIAKAMRSKHWEFA